MSSNGRHIANLFDALCDSLHCMFEVTKSSAIQHENEYIAFQTESEPWIAETLFSYFEIMVCCWLLGISITSQTMPADTHEEHCPVREVSHY